MQTKGKKKGKKTNKREEREKIEKKYKIQYFVFSLIKEEIWPSQQVPPSLPTIHPW